MKQTVESISSTCIALRQRYISIQDDTPTSWSLGATLSYVGLGALAGSRPTTPTVSEEQQRELFTEQPGPETASLLTLYDFVISNKLFCYHLITQPSNDKAQPTPFSAFISFDSYLYQHAYRSTRATLYAYLTLLILLVLVEDGTTTKLLCENTASVRLCRQRPPYLPLQQGTRSYAATIIDLMTDGINHNIRKKLDTKIYILYHTILFRLITYLAKSRTKLAHHWSELWRSLLSFMRFLTTYPDELKGTFRIQELIDKLLDVL